jgi:tetratricopeptide (TPR) repeat protein
MATAAAASADELRKGAVIGRYLVLGLVGRGGMGEVYAAYDPELDRKVAVKLLCGQSSDAQARVRLLREAQAIAKLSHPNVVVVFDVGTFRDSVFIAMEFVEGNTVGYWLQAAPRSRVDILKVFKAAGAGLVAAHAAGMVHRDFKPDNVMVGRDGQVRVMDFGLARRLGADPEPPMQTDSGSFKVADLSEADAEADVDATAKLGAGGSDLSGVSSSSGRYLEQKLTQTGAMLGTPAYMAPEQFAGTSTDARTDQFSFCVALYEALYGHRPFEGDTVVALMANVVSGTVRDAPAGTEVPARLRRVLLRGLEVDPANRFSSMGDLLAELESDGPKHRLGALSAAAAVASVAALVLGGRHFSNARVEMCAGADARLAGIWERAPGTPRKEAIRATFEAKAKGDGARLFAGVSGLLDQFVGRWATMYRDNCEATHVRGEQSAEALDLRMACLGQRLAGVKALTDIFAAADASVIENAANAAGALPNLEACADVEMLRSVVRPPSDAATQVRVDAVRADVARARALGDAGQCAPAIAASGAALSSAKALGYPPLVAEAYYVNGRAGNFCGDGAPAIESLEEAIYAAESAHHDEVAVNAASYAALMYSDRLRDTKAARRWLRYADSILGRLPGHPILEAYTIQAWGATKQAEGKYAEAVRDQERALALLEQSMGSFHPDAAITAMNLGNALHDLGRDADAEPNGRRAVETFERLVGPEGAQVAIALYDWGEALAGLRRNADARQATERAIAIWRQRGASPFYIALARLDLARLELVENRAGEARKLIEDVVEILAKQDPQWGAQARFVLAQSLWPERRERARAVGEARLARAALVASNAPAPKVAEIDAWLAAHAGS